MIYGIATYDSTIPATKHPLYKTWHNMLKRCYSVNYQKQRPTYVGTTVCNEWLLFSNFEKWCAGKFVTGYVLDKDFIAGDLKIYSPETCAFIPKELNNSILERDYNSTYPLGVTLVKQKNGVAFSSWISTFGKKRYLGIRTCEKDAHKLWQIAKKEYFIEILEIHKNLDNSVLDGIRRRISMLEYHIENDLITESLNKV